MDGVERAKIEGIYEYISWLHYLGKIEDSGATWMLRTYADSSQYHNLIGRETNLRWSDDTGLGNATNRLAHLLRLFKGEGDTVVDEINDNNLAFCAMSHMLMLAPELLTPAYGERVKVIEIVRHPLYLVEHFAAYLSRFDSPREFTMSYYMQGTKVPWFAQDFEDAFVNGNAIERAVLCITRLYPWLQSRLQETRQSRLSLLELSFEQIVLQTHDTLSVLSEFLGRAHHPKISSILRRQMLPRREVSKGKGHSKYGWKKNDETEKETYARLMNLVCRNCRADLRDDFFKLVDWYNLQYPSNLVRFASH